MFKDDCIFCKIIEGKIPSYKLYEDDSVFAFLDIGPLSQGHTLVIPKKHYEYIHNCPPDVLSALAAKLGLIAQAVMKSVGCDSYNVLCNNGKSASQVVMHVHFHIIPRKENDGVFTQWPAGKYLPEQAEEIVRKIKSELK